MADITQATRYPTTPAPIGGGDPYKMFNTYLQGGGKLSQGDWESAGRPTSTPSATKIVSQNETAPDLNTIRGNISDMYSSEIASIQSYYNNLLQGNLADQSKVNARNEGLSRASASSAGTLGTSDIGDAIVVNSEQASADANKKIRSDNLSAEQFAESQVRSKVNDTALGQYNTEKATSLSLAKDKQTATLNDIAAIAPNTPLDQLSQSEYDRLYSDSGFADPQLFNDYYTAMSGGNLTQASAESLLKQMQLNFSSGAWKASDYNDPADIAKITKLEKTAQFPIGSTLKTVQKASTFNPSNIDMSTAAPITKAPLGTESSTPDPKTGRTPSDVWQSAIDYALSGKNIQAYLGGLSGSGSGAVLKSKIANTSTYLISSAGVDMPTLQAEFKANSSAISTQVDYLNTTQRAVNNAENGGQQILDVFSGVGINPNDSTYQNTVLNELSKNIGDSGQIRSYQAGLAEIANEYSQVFSRGGSNTVASHYNASDILNGNITLNDLQGVLTELQAQGNIVTQGSIDQIRKITAGGGTDAVANFLGVVYGTGGAQNQGGQGGGSQSKVVNDGSGKSYNLQGYATDPQHAQKVQTALKQIGKMKNPQDVSNYIKNVAPNSPITSQMVQNASQKYGVSWESIMALMQNDSSFGTKGVGSKTSGMGAFNPGNIGNTGTNTNTFSSWQDGVNAVANWLSKNQEQNSGASGSTPKNGDQQSYNGGTYTFDGTQWVLQ